MIAHALPQSESITSRNAAIKVRANGIERLVLELRPEPVEQQEEALA